MLDQRLEQQLRAALRAEGDALPLTITAAELERRLALRRRGRLGGWAGLGLAAAVGFTLLGLAGIAGGWFEEHPPAPIVTPSAAPQSSTAASAAPTAPPIPIDQAILPSLDVLLQPLDPGRIVRAQSVGPDRWPTDTNPDVQMAAGSVTFPPVAVAGAYRVFLSCLGVEALNLRSSRVSPTDPADDIQVTCDSSVTSREIGLAAGDALSLTSTRPTSWRFVLLAPARDAPHATTIAEGMAPPTGDVILTTINSEAAVPVDGPPPVDPPTRLSYDGVPARDGYHVVVTCAGPSAIRYTLGAPRADGAGNLTGEVDEHITNVVECDGRPSTDTLALPLPGGANVYVTADPRDAWQILVTGGTPPITTAPDGDGWQMHVAGGPDLEFEPSEFGFSSALEGDDRDINVVVTCLGGSKVDVRIELPSAEATRTFDTFVADCNATDPTTTAKTVHLPSAAFTVVSAWDAKMWIAVTVQQRVPPPAP